MISRYYLLGNSTGEDVGNVFPQTTGLPPGYDEGSVASMTKLTNETFPLVNPDLRFSLAPEALPTNIINVGNISATGLMMDHKTRWILEDFTIIRHAFYEASVMVNGTAHTYYWLHIVPDGLNGIDFERSRFARYMIPMLRMNKISNVECGSEEEFHHYMDSNQGFEVEKLILAPEFAEKQYDLFFFPRTGTYPDLFAFDRLCAKLMDENVTGMVVVEQQILEI